MIRRKFKQFRRFLTKEERATIPDNMFGVYNIYTRDLNTGKVNLRMVSFNNLTVDLEEVKPFKLDA